MKPSRTLHCFLLLGALGLAMLPGCGGCSQDDTEEAEKDEIKKEKPKKPFEKPRLFVMPNQAPLREPTVDDKGPQASVVRYVKVGHWTSAALEMKANNEDFVGGELEAAVINSQQQPVELPHMPYYLEVSRPATLPKGQTRHLEMTFFVPQIDNAPLLQTELLRGGSTVINLDPEILNPMPAHQYYFVVLSSTADRYKFLDRLASLGAPVPDAGPYYRVVRPVVMGRVPLPAYSLTWTSTAYVLWDGVSPDVMSLEQQNALLDWLHWGGQLVISAPVTLDLLRSSFLKDYLPATSTDTDELSAEDLRPLSDHWTVADGQRADGLQMVKPWAGVKLAPRNGARYVPGCNEFVVEGQVGRGRIVVTAFSLYERELTSWPSFDNFFNACILRRPARTFGPGGDFGQVTMNWTDHAGRQLDPQFTSSLRYFSRDLPWPARPPAKADAERKGAVAASTTAATPTPPQAQLAQPLQWQNMPEQLGPTAVREPGIGGWSDFNSVSSAARDSLRQAAGIEIPKAAFVIAVLAVYLVVLVPLNWTIFKTIGHVEWAWIAAPIISIACALAVIKLAQLDIGFARSQREIAVVEMQSGYSRAHVTRFMALYTSLSTGYDIHFEDPGAVVLPFPVDDSPDSLRNRTRSTVYFRRDQDVSLSGFNVLSNSTAMVHSEEMADMGGSVSLVSGTGRPGVMNNTQFALAGAGAVRRSADGRLETAWLGTLHPGEGKPLTFNPASQDDSLLREWTSLPSDDITGAADAASLQRLLDLARDPSLLPPGEIRLIAWLNEQVPGVRVVPAAAQVRHATLLVVNLGYSSPPVTARDQNLPPREALEMLWEEDEAMFEDSVP
jgi:hypothetical protein